MIYERIICKNNKNIKGRIKSDDLYIQMEIHKKMVELNFNMREIEYFLKNYEKIGYNQYNIKKYVKLNIVMNFDIRDIFFKHIINKYVLGELEYLDKIVCNDVKKIINDICKNPNKLSKKQLLYISKYIDIKELNLVGNYDITDNELMHLQLDSLIAFGSKCKISDNGIKHMKLKVLDASGNKKITDEGIKDMQLEKLYIVHNENITNEGIKNMYLHTLYTGNKSKISDEGIKHMKLHTLNARGSLITNEGIKNMMIHTLIVPFSLITREGIKHMKITKLDTRWNKNF